MKLAKLNFFLVVCIVLIYTDFKNNSAFNLSRLTSRAAMSLAREAQLGGGGFRPPQGQGG